MTTITQDLTSELRPKSLDEVIGHDSIKPAIKKFIEQERRQWLFYGPTGTGKTSLAYIIARDLAGGSETEILDINCADLSPNGLRELISATHTYPMNGKYWVIILDEVQHLSPASRSVLLKPFEEENSTVVWVLCTMDVGKLDKALRDRCLQFQLKPMGQRERHELVSRATSHLNYMGDTSKFLSLIDKHEIGSAREILRAFEKLYSRMSAEDAIEE